MSTTTVSLKLVLRGQQAQQQLNQINKSQADSTTALLRNNRLLEGVLRQQAVQTKLQSQQLQQLTRQTAQQAQNMTRTAGQSKQLLQTNRLLEQLLQQQTRQSTMQSRQLKNQNRDYQVQVNMLRQQVAAAERLREQLRGAGNEQRNMNRGGGTGGGSGFVGGAMGAYMAAKGVIGTPLERARSFETKVFDASTSVTGGYKGMTHQQVSSTNKQLSEYARSAVRDGHGTVDGVGDAAGILAASGLYKTVNELKIPLLAISKTAFANGASEQDLALLTQQIRQFGVISERTQIALDRATTSGFSGGFELRDMARLLPEVLPFAKTAGYSGEEGLNAVTTHMQLARKYTGLPSQAADNMRDLYSLFSQNHFALGIAKYITPEKGDPIAKYGVTKKRAGFDIGTYLMNEKLNGTDSITAIVKLMNRELSKDKRYVSLQSEIQAAEKSGDKSKSLILKKEASDIVAASKFGKIFHNQQSLSGIMSIIAGLNNGDFKKISEDSWDGVGSVDTVAYEKAQIEPSQAHALEQETILATIKIYDQVKGTLGEFEDGLSSTMKANQALAASALVAAGTLTILAAAGAGSRLLGGGAGAGGTGGGIIARVGGAAKTGGQLALAGALGYGFGTVARDLYMQTDTGQKFDSMVGSGVAHVLAAFGNDNAQAAVAAQNSYDVLLEQQKLQQQQIDQQAQTNKYLATLNVNMENMGMRPININGSSMVSALEQPAQQQANRHGSVPFYLQRR